MPTLVGWFYQMNLSLKFREKYIRCIVGKKAYMFFRFVLVTFYL